MSDKKTTITGYAAGIICGISYGTNPLFAKHLLAAGVSVDTMLFFRYLLAAAILGIWLVVRRKSLKVKPNQLELLAVLGVLFATSSLLLFISYNFIPAGLATTIVFLYPVLTALIMVFVKVYPTWQNWLAIAVTFLGVVILSIPSGGVALKWQGIALGVGAALAYSIYLVTVNRSRRLRSVPSNVLTFYALLFGSVLFLVHHIAVGGDFMSGLVPSSSPNHANLFSVWMNLLGLSIIPTIISMMTIAISTRAIGPVKTSILGVFEPITAILIGTMCFGEVLTQNIIIGISLTIIAVIFMILTSKEESI